jgi:zinc protease
MTIRLPSQPLVMQGLDGDAGWVSAGAPARRLAPTDVPTLKAAVLRYSVVKVAGAPDAMRVTGVETVQNRRAYIVEAAVDARTTRRLYFDVETNLLLRDVTVIETIVVPLQNQVDYEDYRDVNGVKLPFTIRSSDGAPYDTSVRRITGIKHNVELDDALFKMPEGRR